MRKLVFIAAAAGCVLAMPAIALADSVTVGANGVTVREGYHHHRYYHHRHHGCRTVTVRTRGPHGVKIRKTRRCD